MMQPRKKVTVQKAKRKWGTLGLATIGDKTRVA